MTLVLLLSPLILTPEHYRSCMDQEMNSALRWYGRAETLEISAKGENIYQAIMGDSGIDGVLMKHFAKPVDKHLDVAPGVEVPEKLATPMRGVLNYWSNLLSNVHLLCYRLAHTWVWMLYVFPFVVAIIFDGIMIRKAKIASFRYTSPTIYNLSWHAIIAIVAFSMVYFVLAFPISIFYYPTMLAIIGILIRMVIGNIQHSA